jgi:type IV secretory pathway protease TraF
VPQSHLPLPNDRVLDNLAYNQSESRRLNEVQQVWRVELNGRTQIFRDVYYTAVPRAGTGLAPDRFDLGDDEYFVLGDNSPISLDSRHWVPPGLHASAIVGKPLGIK